MKCLDLIWAESNFSLRVNSKEGRKLKVYFPGCTRLMGCKLVRDEKRPEETRGWSICNRSVLIIHPPVRRWALCTWRCLACPDLYASRWWTGPSPPAAGLGSPWKAAERKSARNVSVTQHLAHIKTWREKQNKTKLLTPAERIVAGAWRQTPKLAVARVTYFVQLAASSHNEAATPRLGASEQAATAQFKICLFRAITAQNADLIIRGRMCAAAECVIVCFLCDRQSHWAQSNLITGRQKRQLNHTPDTAITRRHD